jgi:predicted protein tyrosine phosphatase
MRVLFVCGRNQWRSPTAEALCAGVEGIEARSCGVNPDAETPANADLIEWAEHIYVMEKPHQAKLQRMFGTQLRDKRISCLAIADKYQYMQPELVSLLQRKLSFLTT